jgi:hypothetical protein
VIKERRMIWAVHVVCMGEIRNVYNNSVIKPEWKRLLGRPRHRYEGNNEVALMGQDMVVLLEFIWLRIGTGSSLL